ncbi:MAG: hypothetical protein RSA52_08885, partial [Acetivibrio sp.]
ELKLRLKKYLKLKVSCSINISYNSCFPHEYRSIRLIHCQSRKDVNVRTVKQDREIRKFQQNGTGFCEGFGAAQEKIIRSGSRKKKLTNGSQRRKLQKIEYFGR